MSFLTLNTWGARIILQPTVWSLTFGGITQSICQTVEKESAFPWSLLELRYEHYLKHCFARTLFLIEKDVSDLGTVSHGKENYRLLFQLCAKYHASWFGKGILTDDLSTWTYNGALLIFIDLWCLMCAIVMHI